MSRQRPLAVVTSYAELMTALRARLTELGINYETLDQLAGWTDTYATKLLAPKPQKHLGPMSFDAMFPALAVQIAILHDPAQLQKIKQHRDFRPRQRPTRVKLSTPLSMAERGRIGGLRRALTLGPQKRRRIARNAAKARWARSVPCRRPKDPA